MAWYGIDHACGHSREVQIYGTNVRGERERKAASMEKRPCPDCEAETRRARNAAASETAARQAAEAGWPKLTGSDKQIASAETIRAETMAKLADDLATVANREGADAAEPFGRIYREVLLRETRADKWIEGRRGGWKRTVKKFATPADFAAMDEAKKETGK